MAKEADIPLFVSMLMFTSVAWVFFITDISSLYKFFIVCGVIIFWTIVLWLIRGE